jgi:hypothetical protein
MLALPEGRWSELFIEQVGLISVDRAHLGPRMVQGYDVSAMVLWTSARWGNWRVVVLGDTLNEG